MKVDQNKLATLKAHQNDPAYEVKLQIEMAITRIENGEASTWISVETDRKS